MEPSQGLHPSPARPRILIVEDDPSFRSMLQANLEGEGFETCGVDDGLPALEAHRQRPFDLILLDLMLPHLDGFQLITALRGVGDEVPVLFLSARGEERTRLQGFDLGADDYLVKPFSILELFSRIRAILKRTHKGSGDSGARRLLSGPFVLDRDALTFCRGKKNLGIGIHGFRTLEALFLRAGHIHTRSELETLAWGPQNRPTNPRTVDVNVSNLRKLLGPQKDWLATVGGVGYRWIHPVQPE